MGTHLSVQQMLAKSSHELQMLVRVDANLGSEIVPKAHEIDLLLGQLWLLEQPQHCEAKARLSRIQHQLGYIGRPCVKTRTREERGLEGLKMTQQVKVLSANLGILRLLPGIHTEGKNRLLQAVLWLSHIYTHLHTLNKQINISHDLAPAWPYCRVGQSSEEVESSEEVSYGGTRSQKGS